MPTPIARRHFCGWAAASTAALLLAGCEKKRTLDPQDVAAGGKLPNLQFSLTDADTGKTVTAADFRGKVVMLYFGYTNCPNVCPLTLSDTARMFNMIGKPAEDIRFLFVTVDPQRDTLAAMRHYTSLFGSNNIIGMRGSEAELRAAASRYHAGYTVHPSPDPAKYTVTHTAAVYVFNQHGKSEFIIAGLAGLNPDLKGIAADLKHLAMEGTV